MAGPCSRRHRSTTPSTDISMQKATSTAPIVEATRISRGKYTFLIRLLFAISEPMDAVVTGGEEVPRQEAAEQEQREGMEPARMPGRRLDLEEDGEDDREDDHRRQRVEQRPGPAEHGALVLAPELSERKVERQLTGLCVLLELAHRRPTVARPVAGKRTECTDRTTRAAEPARGFMSPRTSDTPDEHPSDEPGGGVQAGRRPKPLLHSLAEFRELILGCCELVGARTVVEIGCEWGYLTSALADWAAGGAAPSTASSRTPRPSSAVSCSTTQPRADRRRESGGTPAGGAGRRLPRRRRPQLLDRVRRARAHRHRLPHRRPPAPGPAARRRLAVGTPRHLLLPGGAPR